MRILKSRFFKITLALVIGLMSVGGLWSLGASFAKNSPSSLLPLPVNITIQVVDNMQYALIDVDKQIYYSRTITVKSKEKPPSMTCWPQEWQEYLIRPNGVWKYSQFVVGDFQPLGNDLWIGKSKFTKILGHYECNYLAVSETDNVVIISDSTPLYLDTTEILEQRKTYLPIITKEK